MPGTTDPPDPAVYHLSWTAEYADVRDAVRWNLRRSRGKLLWALRGLAVVYALVWVAGCLASGRLMLGQLLGLAVYTLFVVAYPMLLTWAAWNQAKRVLGGGSEAEVGAGGLRLTQGGVESRYPWSALRPPERSGRVWVFPLAAAKLVVMIPRRAVPVPDEEFAAYVAGRAGGS